MCCSHYIIVLFSNKSLYFKKIIVLWVTCLTKCVQTSSFSWLILLSLKYKNKSRCYKTACTEPVWWCRVETVGRRVVWVAVTAVAAIPAVVCSVALCIASTVTQLTLVARESREIAVAAILTGSLVRTFGVATSVSNLRHCVYVHCTHMIRQHFALLCEYDWK